MNKKIKLFMLFCLVLCGCGVKEELKKEIISESEKVEVNDKKEEVENLNKPKEYNNIINGLINKDNEFELNVEYMLLDKQNKKVGDKMTPTYIVIHNTANSAPAVNEAKYLNSANNTSSTSFHFAVDDSYVYQTVDLNYNSWHAGNRNMNKKSIGIEIAKSTVKDVKVKDKAIDNGAKLTAMLLKKYDISIDNVITHNEVTGKDCPHDILHRYGFENFIKLVEKYLVINS